MSSVNLPPILHIGSRHYRVNLPKNAHSTALPVPVSQLEELSLDDTDVIDDDIVENVQVLESDQGDFVARIYIPVVFHRHLTGPNREKLHQIEHDLACTVILPQDANKSSHITIKSSTRRGVLDACRRISWIQTTARSHVRPTHFICLPATQSEIQRNFTKFRESVLTSARRSSPDFAGIHEGIFHSPSLLHFTIVPLLLADDAEVSRAIDVLKQILRSAEGSEAFSGGPLRLTVKGLEYMNDDPNAVNVLYAKISPSEEKERLQRMANLILKVFMENELVGGRQPFMSEAVLLHMTVLKTRSGAAEPFSVTGILREYGDFVFGKNVLFDEFHLSLMRSQSDDGFFIRCCSIKLSSSEEPKLVIDNAA